MPCVCCEGEVPPPPPPSARISAADICFLYSSELELPKRLRRSIELRIHSKYGPALVQKKNTIHVLSTVSSTHKHQKKLTAHFTHRMRFR
jgi:hypothetical protein